MNKKRITFGKVLIYFVLSFWSLFTLYPFIWVLLNSFKEKNIILVDSFSIPLTTFTFDNYKAALYGRYNILRAYLNSFLISGSVVILVIFITAFSSFALARYEFKAKKLFTV